MAARVLKALTANCEHANDQVRFTACHALARLKASGWDLASAMPVLEKVAQSDSNRYARAWAHVCIVRQGQHPQGRKHINTRWCELTTKDSPF